MTERATLTQTISPADLERMDYSHSNLSARHAFDCETVYNRAYREAIAAGASPREAGDKARETHNSAVTWIFDNVGLD